VQDHFECASHGHIVIPGRTAPPSSSFRQVKALLPHCRTLPDYVAEEYKKNRLPRIAVTELLR
jgi:hypothetical protein